MGLLAQCCANNTDVEGSIPLWTSEWSFLGRPDQLHELKPKYYVKKTD